jgi:hypothetical protein
MRASGIRAQEFSYITNGGAITVTGYSGPGGAVTIPGTISGLPVTAIEGFGGFSSTNLTSVTIPNSVISIGDFAFKSCNCSTISIGDNVTSIGMDAFAQCTSLATVRIPDNVLSVGVYAFTSCSRLTNVIIGKGLTNLSGDSAFYYCTNLLAITVDKDNQAFWSASGVLFDRSQTRLLRFPSGTTGSYDVPQGVIEIGRNAFNGSSLAALTIPNSVTNIDSGALQNCPSLTGIYFKGSAPALVPGPMAFFGGTPAVIYYLPGTAGWGVSFGGRPTALWVLPFPLILTSGPSFGPQGNQFGFTISWATNLDVVVEASTNLAGALWKPLQTNTLAGGASYFTDPQWTNYPTRFYRIRSP